ncbi:uncharacterized protein EAE98_008038 [Botrytis deweyae]|uniref:Uncharacterized protein n=1 Tax=Botrytis deweyae TaxID=2478750 RepID=A0ABQ7IFI4_9HELO|nr:uncharacterized protein EAE98_008038 [Botrytis deweyae]KAF7922512.1 hypothetical protein EAE98_008038 [Botrytis deweyae]
MNSDHLGGQGGLEVVIFLIIHSRVLSLESAPAPAPAPAPRTTPTPPSPLTSSPPCSYLETINKVNSQIRQDDELFPGDPSNAITT